MEPPFKRCRSPASRLLLPEAAACRLLKHIRAGSLQDLEPALEMYQQAAEIEDARGNPDLARMYYTRASDIGIIIYACHKQQTVNRSEITAGGTGGDDGKDKPKETLVTFKLKNGETIRGTIKYEMKAKIRVKTEGNQMIFIQTEDIVSRSDQ